jgi:hypothetical protein
MSKTYTIDVQENADGELFIEFPPELMTEADWKEGDDLVWTDLKDGTWSLRKKPETQWVLVEAISTFRERYMVEVPIGTDDHGKDKALWALDTVTCEDAQEFSQEFLGEQIVSHRVVTKEEALKLCDEDNDYHSASPEELKVKLFFTTWKEQENE